MLYRMSMQIYKLTWKSQTQVKMLTPCLPFRNTSAAVSKSG